MRVAAVLGWAVLSVAALHAQQPAPPSVLPASSPATATDTLYVRAQRLVNEGKGVEGRAIVDSLFRLASPGSTAHADALFWRATLATTALDAERDYRQLTVDYPLSPRAEDALLRLAQLDLQRGDRALALAHLERLLREHASGPARARGAYWSARVHFEMNDAARACRSLNDARLALPAGDVELRNQIEYAAQRCPTPIAAASGVTQTPTTVPPAGSMVVSGTAGAASTPADTASRAATAARSTDVAAPRTVRTAPSTPPSQDPVATPRATEAAPAARNAPVREEPQRFSVQVAAYQTRPEAEQLVRKYRANGYDARAYGTVAPFRVRIGRFRTRAEAVELAKVLKQKSGAAFVVVAETK